MDLCVVCGYDKPEFAFPLTKENGKWAVKPVCRKCKAALVSEARAQGKFIMIYPLDKSLEEAEKRNANTPKYMPFLEAFAKPVEEKASRPANESRKFTDKAKAKGTLARP